MPEIKDPLQHQAALADLDRLMSRATQDVEPSALERIEALATNIEAYEREAFPIPSVPPAAILEHLLDARNMSWRELAQALGLSDTDVFSISSGQAISAEQADRFAKYFALPSELFREDP